MQREFERNQKVTTGPMTPVTRQNEATVRRDMGPSALFPANQANDLGGEWAQIQAGFVDDPRSAVGRASELVGRAVGALTSQFDRERSNLEQQWARGEDVSTEELRVALQRYRSFFQRLLSV
jgi:hypothetical protein